MKISDALRTSDELLAQLQCLALQANHADNRALFMVLRQQVEKIEEIHRDLNELAEVGL